MSNDAALRLFETPQLDESSMILAFSGWMDGGEVSTGTVERIGEAFDARRVGIIDPEPFYISNFPGPMEVSSLFRPHVAIENGCIVEYDEPENTFYCSEEQKLILFSGKEPNIRWHTFADCMFSVVREFNVKTICFIGSVAGVVPHTREPRIFGSVSSERLEPIFHQHGLVPSNYEGPASFVTFLTVLAKRRGLDMASLVVETPAYVQGRNPVCIEAGLKVLGALLGLPLVLDDFHRVSEEFVRELDRAVLKRPDLAEQIRRMERRYDDELSGAHTTEIEDWFESQGIRLD